MIVGSFVHADLVTLKLSKNNITDISALANLNNLEYLNLSENNITDFTVLDQLSNMDSADNEGL
jgi:Leucine-rich repeat (LRR) protein